MTDNSTRIDEIADGIYRISTPVPPEAFPGGFTFNQFLIKDDDPLVYHTGLQGIFTATRAAIEKVMPVEEYPLRVVLAFRGRRMRRAERFSRGRTKGAARFAAGWRR